jgi:hypothetical protein
VNAQKVTLPTAVEMVTALQKDGLATDMVIARRKVGVLILAATTTMAVIADQ